MPVRPFALAAVACLLVGCGSQPSSPAAPTPPLPPASLTGVWQVTYTGRTSSGCRTAASITTTTVFRFTQTGDTISGTMFDVAVAGAIDDAGRLTLTGSANDFARSQVRATLQVAPDRSAFSGSFSATLGETPSYPCGTSIFETTIVATERVAISTSRTDFAGTWSGTYGIRDCSYTGSLRDCWPGQKGSTQSVRLQLTQGGTSATGTLTLGGDQLPVAGTIRDNILTLEGSVTKTVSGGREVIRLLDWTTTRTELGQMNGQFSYVFEYVPDAGGGFSTTFDSVLIGFTLSPR